MGGGRLWAGGGGQEARGSASLGGAEWYVENGRELLDSAGEWFYSHASGVLYLATNSSVAPPSCFGAGGLSEILTIGEERGADDEAEVPRTDDGARHAGSGGAEAQGTRAQRQGQGQGGRRLSQVLVKGVVFMHSASTFVRRYAAPNGGDWSYFAGAAVAVRNSDGVEVDACEAHLFKSQPVSL